MTASNPTVWLTLQAHDASKLIDYFVDTFGFVVTSDPDGLYQRVLDRQAEVIRPLTDTDYGAREFAVRDPEGNLWSFGNYAGAQ